jgi:RimJ/RimL family protein N-acetyltransferase
MSERVTVEPLMPADFGMAAQWLSEAQTNQWLTSDWRGRNVDSVLIGIAARNKKNRLYLVRHDGEACGLVALSDLDRVDRTAMVWYVLGNKNVGGQGITTSAVRELLRLAFSELQLEAVHAWIMADNNASRRVLEKAGFREAGRLRSAASHDGRSVDRIYFDMTSSDSDQQLRK